MMIFDNWNDIFRILLIAPLTYGGLLFMLRISGSRTLSQMSAFDFIITVALGSTLSAVIIDKNVSLAEGVAALAALILLQYLITWLSIRSETLLHLFHAKPHILLKNGKIIPSECRKARVTEQEILQALRSAGLLEPDEANQVVLENNGRFSVVRQNKD